MKTFVVTVNVLREDGTIVPEVAGLVASGNDAAADIGFFLVEQASFYEPDALDVTITTRTDA